MLKKSICLFAFAACLVPSFAQENPSSDEVSRAIGVLLGLQLKEINLPFEYDILVESLKATLEGADADEAQAVATLEAAFAFSESKAAEENLSKGQAFLASNAKKKGVKTTQSGLQYEIIEPGKGAKPTADSLVSVYYEGSLIDGTVFDSNTREEDGEPVEIPLGEVIPGWAEGVQLIANGGRIKLFIPPDLGYGSQSAGAMIPENSVLIFEVELVAVNTGSD
jgi:FKBP-type peptidyl-prolyl cis-trans isomerase FklB